MSAELERGFLGFRCDFGWTRPLDFLTARPAERLATMRGEGRVPEADAPAGQFVNLPLTLIMERIARLARRTGNKR